MSATYPFESIPYLGLGGFNGDTYFYYKKEWFHLELEDFTFIARFKNFWQTFKINYGIQFKYTKIDYSEGPTPSVAGFFSIGKYYRNHDISEGYQFNLNTRIIGDNENHYTFNSNFQKSWYIPIYDNSLVRGYQINCLLDYSNIEDDASVIGVILSGRGGALHGLRGNSIFAKNFGTASFRFGITSQKFLWTFWQPHIFLEAGLSDQDSGHSTDGGLLLKSYYSVGGGLLLTFPALYNSRLRIQYYLGDLPDRLSGIIISTSLDF